MLDLIHSPNGERLTLDSEYLRRLKKFAFNRSLSTAQTKNSLSVKSIFIAGCVAPAREMRERHQLKRCCFDYASLNDAGAFLPFV